MNIFMNELLVGGIAVSGRIKDKKFIMTGLKSSNSLKPPIKDIVFDKEWLGIAIEELKAVRDRL